MSLPIISWFIRRGSYIHSTPRKQLAVHSELGGTESLGNDWVNICNKFKLLLNYCFKGSEENMDLRENRNECNQVHTLCRFTH